MSTIFPLPSSPHCAPSTAILVCIIRPLSYSMRYEDRTIVSRRASGGRQSMSTKLFFDIPLTTLRHGFLLMILFGRPADGNAGYKELWLAHERDSNDACRARW